MVNMRVKGTVLTIFTYRSHGMAALSSFAKINSKKLKIQNKLRFERYSRWIFGVGCDISDVLSILDNKFRLSCLSIVKVIIRIIGKIISTTVLCQNWSIKVHCIGFPNLANSTGNPSNIEFKGRLHAAG